MGMDFPNAGEFFPRLARRNPSHPTRVSLPNIINFVFYRIVSVWIYGAIIKYGKLITSLSQEI